MEGPLAIAIVSTTLTLSAVISVGCSGAAALASAFLPQAASPKAMVASSSAGAVMPCCRAVRRARVGICVIGIGM